ncbi:MAG TPA: MG2 domain-containing protein, partial [Polyangia bacterium]|nr:MG2 domain-containing protein [Polyangia bacterium]
MLIPLRMLCLALVCLAACGGTPLSPHARGEAGAITWRNAVHVDVDWSRIDRLMEDQKFEEASREVREILAKVRDAGDEEQWTRALIKEVQLRTALHGYETAVRFLKEEKWPEGLLARMTLELFYAHGLVTYLRNDSWEIRKRERVESRGPVDLKAWTSEQIWAEALAAYERVWEHRAELGGTPVGVLKEYVTPNNYPQEVRGTLRDAVSYLSVELLSDSGSWRAELASAAERLELGPLLDGNPGGSPVSGTLRLDDLAVHPLVQVVAVLDDLERWHLAGGRKAAMLEARLERLRRLRNQFNEPEERSTIRQRLEALLPAYRQESWWSMGMLMLAELVHDEGDLVRAAQLADEGHKAYPDSPGGLRCDHLARSIRAPDARFTTMSADALGKRSIEVMHKNLGALHFRAYAVDLLARIAASRDYNLLPAYQEFQSLLTSAQPAASWTVTLPATPDDRAHRTFVTPPMSKPGLYAIFASTEPSFALTGNRLLAQNLLLGDLVLQTSVDGSGEATVTTLSGASGRPVAGVEVSFYQYDYRRGHHVVATQKSDAHGEVRWSGRGREGNNFFVVARRGAEVTLDTTPLSSGAPPGEGENRAALVYTDRGIYRPEQTLHWKVIGYHGRPGQLATQADARMTVTLYDANGQKVTEQAVTTNAYGSAAGEFVLPAGRLLGEWRLVTEPFSGSASVRVEEYKRPTFEVTIKDPEQGLRINRPATVSGEARYYFGLPVASGTVRWRVARQILRPWWWGFWYGEEGVGNERVLASGTAPLQADGSFKMGFTPAADEREARRPGVSYRYLVTAQLTDEGGETRSAERSFRLGFVSVEAEIDRAASFFVAGQPAELTVTRTSLDGLARPGKGAWRLVSLAQPKETPLPAELPVKPAKLPGGPQPVDDPPGASQGQRYETPGDQLRARWATDYSMEQVMAGWADGKEAGRGEVVHDAKGSAKVALPALAPGAYRLHYQTVDDFGASYETWKDLVIAGAAGQATPLALPAVLLTEKSAAKVGERVRLFVHSGLQDELLVLDRYRDGRIVERRRIESSPGQGGLVELPVEEGDRGGFGLVLTALRDHQPMQLSARVFVPWDDKELKVEFASFRDRLRPGGKETWRVVVKGAGGKAEAGAAELLAYMYDRSLDVFAPHVAPSVMALYPNRAHTGWVRTNLGSAGAQWMATG